MATSKIFKKLVGDKARAAAPIKIIAVCLTVIAVLWIVISVAGDRWVIASFRYTEDRTWDWGLWNTCHTLEDGNTVCVAEDWLTACLVFSIMSLILSLAATICGILGIRFADNDFRRNLFYNGAAGFLFAVVLLELLVVIIYPVKFAEDIRTVSTVRRWDFDWAYGFAWGALVFALGAALFYLVPGKYEMLSLTSERDVNDRVAQVYSSQDA